MKSIAKIVSVDLCLASPDSHAFHEKTIKGLYATMKRWRIDPWLYGRKMAQVIYIKLNIY